MECGMWSENSTEIQYSYTKSLVLEIKSHSSFHIPHSTINTPHSSKKSLRNLDVLHKVTLAVSFRTIDHEMTTWFDVSNVGHTLPVQEDLQVTVVER